MRFAHLEFMTVYIYISVISLNVNFILLVDFMLDLITVNSRRQVVEWNSLRLCDKSTNHTH